MVRRVDELDLPRLGLGLGLELDLPCRKEGMRCEPRCGPAGGSVAGGGGASGCARGELQARARAERTPNSLTRCVASTLW